ncbi:hypothetical protein DORLON_00465 [Dorea longicatena DSM 13814]|uniref:Uncharacterized protein n=1 Tax=Dorea longicatena DSM 13814 TaxID=411462 RepID=A6BDU9_9FIRM|nr:hypothetical protein DORLON_00465 [Dorea longicatena DSM 13814]
MWEGHAGTTGGVRNWHRQRLSVEMTAYIRKKSVSEW